MLSSRRGRPTRTSLAFADVLWFFDDRHEIFHL
jgi:hypothetical protein